MTAQELQTVVDSIIRAAPSIGENFSRADVAERVRTFVTAIVSEAREREVED